MSALVFGQDQVGNRMTNAIGTSVRVQDHYNEVREIVKGYFPCIMGSVMANKIAILIPAEKEDLNYRQSKGACAEVKKTDGCFLPYGLWLDRQAAGFHEILQ